MAQIKIRRRITISEMAPHVHSFGAGENKVNKIVDWLSAWIDNALKQGKIKQFDLLPSKGELAYHIGVSQGTVQNVFRQLEDMGIIESKQKIGTYVNGSAKTKTSKLTSKREFAIEIIKKFIIDKNYKNGEHIMSAREIAKNTNVSYTTTRLAIMRLVSIGILRQDKRSFILNDKDYDLIEIKTETLVEKIAQKIEDYISQNLHPSNKLPTNSELAEKFDSSIKTIHDAIKLLAQKGIVYTRRGRYGTIVADVTNQANNELYDYEKFAVKIRDYINKNCVIGDKLPSIKSFSQIYGTSEKTIKKALDIFAEDGYITYARGRYGGTFLVDMPPKSKDAYKWLAINNEYISQLKN